MVTTWWCRCRLRGSAVRQRAGAGGPAAQRADGGDQTAAPQDRDVSCVLTSPRTARRGVPPGVAYRPAWRTARRGVAIAGVQTFFFKFMDNVYSFFNVSFKTFFAIFVCFLP